MQQGWGLVTGAAAAEVSPEMSAPCASLSAEAAPVAAAVTLQSAAPHTALLPIASAPPLLSTRCPGCAAVASAVAAGRPLPRVASSAPVRLHMLQPGEGGGPPAPCACGRQHVVLGQAYRYCTCGHSVGQPWCDDTCIAVGSPFQPREIRVEKSQTFLLMCACKRTQDPLGRCDGEHIHVDYSKLDW